MSAPPASPPAAKTPHGAPEEVFVPTLLRNMKQLGSYHRTVAHYLRARADDDQDHSWLGVDQRAYVHVAHHLLEVRTD